MNFHIFISNAISVQGVSQGPFRVPSNKQQTSTGTAYERHQDTRELQLEQLLTLHQIGDPVEKDIPTCGSTDIP